MHTYNPSNGEMERQEEEVSKNRLSSIESLSPASAPKDTIENN